MQRRSDELQKENCLSTSVQVCYLVVDDNVHGAVRGVGRQVRQVEGFVDDTLTGESCVSVDQDGHHLEKNKFN